MLTWKELLSTKRRKEEHRGEDAKKNTGDTRLPHEVDYDRLLFSAPTRRLADKTQVFPLEVLILTLIKPFGFRVNQATKIPG